MASPEPVWFSHATAAQLHGIWLPPRLASLDVVDVTVPSPMHAPRGRGVRGRQRSLETSFIHDLDGLPVSTPAQTFVDLVDVLSVEDLVAAGDCLLSVFAPIATRAELADAVAAHAGRRGHRRLVTAFDALVERSRSRPETLYRLEFLAQGAPMPRLNETIRLPPGGDHLTPDFTWLEAALVTEYEGDQHRTSRDQWQHDLGRYNAVQASGWEVHRVSLTTRNAMRADVAIIVARIRARWDPTRELPFTTRSWPGNGS